MRPAKQIKVISSQLEILDEFKTQLESVLQYTNNVIQKGNAWIKEENNETFFKINKFLTDESYECIRLCQDLTNDKNEDSEQHSGLQEQDTRDIQTKSQDTLTSPRSPGLNFREENEYKQLFEKFQELDKTFSLQSKKIIKLEQKFQEHKNETKNMSRDRKESENKNKIKIDEIMDEIHKASKYMYGLETQNEDVINHIKEHDKQMSSVIETLHSVQEQIKENEQKSETFMKQQKISENSFSLRLDELTRDILGETEIINKVKSDNETLFNMVNKHTNSFDTIIPNLQEKINDFEETQESNRKKFDDVYNIIQSTDILDKIAQVSRPEDNMLQEIFRPREQSFFFAQAYGDMNVQRDLYKDEIVTSFGHVLSNIGNHYDRTTGIFTAPCDGLYLCSLTLRFDIGENVYFGIRVNSSSGESYKCYLQTTNIKSSASVTTILSLKQSDQLYISTAHDYEQIKLNVYSYFMCALYMKA